MQQPLDLRFASHPLQMLPPTPSLVDLVRSTLATLENVENFSPHDAAAKELKASLLRTLAELEVKKANAQLEES